MRAYPFEGPGQNRLILGEHILIKQILLVLFEQNPPFPPFESKK